MNDAAPKINFTYFAATCPIIASVPEHRLSSHPDQVFIKYVCSDLRDDFDLGYLGHTKKCEILRNLILANENPDLVRHHFSSGRVDAY